MNDKNRSNGSGHGKITVFFLVTTCFLLSCAKPQPVPHLRGVKTETLQNGMKVMIVPNGTPEKIVYLRLVVKAGSVRETNGERGYAHFVEHLAFDATGRLGAGKTQAFMESLGMDFGPESNAYTNYDSAEYRIAIPAGNSDYLRTGLDILKAWAFDIAFTDDTVEAEKPVILEELRETSDFGWTESRAHLENIFYGSPYAYRDPIGTETSVTGATAAGLKAFYRKWYKPSLMCVIVTGDVDPTDTAEAIRASLESERNGHPEEPTDGVSMDDTEIRQKFISYFEDQRVNPAYTSLAFRIPRRDQKDGLAAMQERLAASAIESRIRRAETGYFTSLTSTAIYRLEPWKNASVLVVSHENNPENWKYTFKDLFREIEKIRKFGFTKDELESALGVASLEADRSAAISTIRHSLAIADDLFLEYVYGDIAKDPVLYPGYLRDLLANTRIKDLNAAAQTLLDDKRMSVLFSAPPDSGYVFPSETEVARAKKEILSEKLIPSKTTPPRRKIMEKIPEPSIEVAERKCAYPAYVEWEFGNGATVRYCRNTQSYGRLYFTAQSQGGYLAVPDKLLSAAKTLTGAIAENAPGDMPLLDFLEAKNRSDMYLDSRVSPTRESISGEVQSIYAEEFFQSIHRFMGDGPGNRDAFQKFADREKNLLKSRESFTKTSLDLSWSRFLWKDNPVCMQPESSDYLTVSWTEAKEAWKDRFGSPNDFIFAFSGDLDENTVRNLARRYIATLETKGDVDTKSSPDITRKNLIRENLKKGGNTSGYVTLGKILPERTCVATSASSHVFRIMLERAIFNELREKRGEIYSLDLSSNFYSSVAPHILMVKMDIESSPVNIPKIAEFLSGGSPGKLAIAQGPTAFESARLTAKRQLRKELTDGAAMVGFLSFNPGNNLKPESIFESEAALDGLTFHDIELFADRYDGAGGICLAAVKE